MSVEDRVSSIGNELRSLKERLAQEQVTNVNGHEDVIRLVAELKAAKQQLPVDSSLSEAAFKKEKKKAEELKKRVKQDALDRHKKRLKDALKTLKVPHVQRKIYHVFATDGAGPSFRYTGAELNTDLSSAFNTQDPVFLTEKWDGSTFQATSRAIFQRLDNGQRDSTNSSPNRYELTLRAWREDQDGEWQGLDFLDAKVEMALRPYLDAITQLEDGLCVYFEICHRNINVSYKCFEENWCALRVFDFSHETGFLPYEKVQELMAKYDLPTVGTIAKLGPGWTPEQLWEFLRQAKNMGYQGLPPGPPLEGFVVRSGHAIAKARVEYFNE